MAIIPDKNIEYIHKFTGAIVLISRIHPSPLRIYVLHKESGRPTHFGYDLNDFNDHFKVKLTSLLKKL